MTWQGYMLIQVLPSANAAASSNMVSQALRRSVLQAIEML
jgi:hypothetical protein